MKYFLICLIGISLLSCKSDTKTIPSELIENTKITGPVFGTSYAIIYDSEIDYSKQFDSLFTVINQSMSTYIPESDISRLNRGDAVSVDEHFVKVFNTSKDIFKSTNGTFDPTIGDVVNAWSFGADKRKFLTDSTTIDSLMQYVGFDKVKLERNTVIKPKGTYLEFNAIAKGYGVDVIAAFLESKNSHNYLVEIGGEIRTKGINKEKKASWQVGLDQPRFDGGRSVMKAISIENVGMATSGTYRKFKTDDTGNRYAHIINTKTGYPAKTNILSVSVIAGDCMTADGYATAFQAMGIEAVRQFLQSHPELKVFLVFENENQELDTLNLNGFPEQ